MTISARIVAHSVGPHGGEIITFELEFPRFILPEFNTHRLFSRNAASSRAIPVERAISLIQENTAMPIHWGKNQPGMSAKEECFERVFIEGEQSEYSRENAWKVARDNAIHVAECFNHAGYHKQIVNRLLEPFSHIKVVVTSTEWNNWFSLRNHPDAMPEICELAKQMEKARSESKPYLLHPGEWHVPYFLGGQWTPQCDGDNTPSLQDALAISSSCCAQVSYRRLDDSVEKARDIYKRLVESKPVHASPFEHQATPIHDYEIWPDGATHVDREGVFWSGNFRNWIQHRQLIRDNVVPG